MLDAWGWPIYATHPGRVHDPNVFNIDTVYPGDRDGTVRTYNEDIYGIASNRQVRFVSAGPDGKFGMLGASEDSEEFKQTKDNLFSYPTTPP